MGLSKGQPFKKIGMKAQDTCELFFDNVKIPKENQLGDETKGFSYLMQGLAEERLIVACQCLASAQKAFDLTRDYVLERRAFGKRIADFQNTQFVMADLRADLDVMQAYIDQCVAIHSQGNLTIVEAAKAKLKTSELQGKMVDACLQFFGGSGYIDEYPISRLYADARVSRIYAGTSEVMKLLIGREVFAEDYKPFSERC